MIAIVAIVGIVSLTAAVIFGKKPVVPAIQPDPVLIALFMALIFIPWVIVAIKIFREEFNSPKYDDNECARDIQDSHCNPSQGPAAENSQYSDADKPDNNDGRRTCRC